MWLKAENGMYVCELRGVVFVTWVFEQDREHAAVFPIEQIASTIRLLSQLTGLTIEAVEPH